MSILWLYFRWLRVLSKFFAGPPSLSKNGKKQPRRNLEILISCTNKIVTNYLIGPLIRPYKLSQAVALYCEGVNHRSHRSYIRTYIHVDEENITKSAKNRLFLVITHACFYARVHNASCVLLYLSMDKDRVSIMLDTDIPIMDRLESSSDIISMLTWDHLHKLGAKLGKDRIGLKDHTYRLSLTVGPKPAELLVEQLITA